MEKEEIKAGLRVKLLKLVNYIVAYLAILGVVIITYLHFMVPFFPVLFLFDICFWIGHRLFLERVLHRKWTDCTKDDYLSIKYLELPMLIMELLVMLYYYQESMELISDIVS